MKEKLNSMLSGITAAALIGLVVFAGVETTKVNKFIDGQLERQANEEEQAGDYQEDGYEVMNEYEIRSTTQISDAYISGDSSKLNNLDKQTLDTASKILDDIIKEGMTPYEKELAVYDYLYKNIGQGSSTVVTMPINMTDSDFTPQGVLQSHEAVCVGYATTFRMFMQMLELECHIVHNDVHSWDLVKLDDDQWYHVDIYTDVSSNTEYLNFNVTDAVMSNSNDWEKSALPAANGHKYTYAAQHNKEIKSIYDVPEKVNKAIGKKKHLLYFSFKEKIGDEEMLVTDELFNEMNSALMASGRDNITLSGSWYVGENDKYILGVYISDTNEMVDTSQQLPEKLRKKVSKKVADVFGVSEEEISSGASADYGIDAPANEDVDGGEL